MNEIESINEIAKQLKEIIQRENRKAIKAHGDDWKEKYEWLCSDIGHELELAMKSLENMKQLGLSLNAIESEGYLRCAIVISDIIKNIELSYNE